MKVTPVTQVKGGSIKTAVTLRRDAQLAYGARTKPVTDSEAEAEDEHGLGLRARAVDSDFGPTVLLTERDDRPGSPMLLLSTKLFRKLLATARAIGPPRPAAREDARRRLDIRV
jgi:hypothetical protein